MGLLDNLFNFKLASPELSYQNNNVDNKKEMRVYAPQTSNQTTTTNTFNPIDSRQITLVLNSSDVTTKKADRSGANITPTSTQSPVSSFVPDFETSNPSQSASASQGNADTSKLGTWFIIGAIAIGVIMIAGHRRDHGK